MTNTLKCSKIISAKFGALKGTVILDVIIYGFAVLKNVIYGSSIFFTSRLTQNVDVLDILALRFLMSFAALFLLKVTGLVKMNITLKDFSRKSGRRGMMISLLLTGLFEPVLYMAFETLGISMTTNITAAVILSLSPVFCVICEFVFLGERIDRKKGFFLSIGMIGAIYIAVNAQSSGGTDSLIGIISVLLAVITGALFTTFSRKTSAAFGAMEITYFSCLMGAVAFNAVNIARHISNGTLSTYFVPFMSVDNMIGFVFLAIISTIIATGMNNFALARMQVSTMAAFTGLSTFVSVVIGVLFNNERLYMYHIIGISLIMIRVIGIICLTAGENKKITEVQEAENAKVL